MTRFGQVYSRIVALSIPDRVELISRIALYLGIAVSLLVGILVVRSLLLKGRPRTELRLLRAASKAVVGLAFGMTGAVFLSLVWLSYVTYLDRSIAPAEAYDVQVLSEQGVLAFTYPNGKVSKDRLVVPSNKPVRLVLSSKDAARGIAIPQLKLRQTAESGRYTAVWFQAPGSRTLPMRCTQGCSAKHPEPTLQALDPAQFEAWLASREPVLSDDPTRQVQHAGPR